MDWQNGLRLFSEKFSRLERTKLAAQLSQKEFEHEDDLDAYLLTLRFFVQDNEPCSIRNVQKTYLNHCTFDWARREFLKTRTSLNDELDKKTPFGFHSGKHHKPNETVKFTYRFVFEGLLYGIYAHSTFKQHEIVEEMLASSFGKHINQGMFLHVVELFHFALRDIEQLNRKAFPQVF